MRYLHYINKVSFSCIFLSLLFVCFSYTSANAQLTNISKDVVFSQDNGERWFFIEPSRDNLYVQVKIYVGNSETATPTGTNYISDWEDLSVADFGNGQGSIVVLLNEEDFTQQDIGKFFCVTARERGTTDEVSACATPAISRHEIVGIDNSAPNFVRIEEISASRSSVTFSVVVEHNTRNDKTGEAETFSVRPSTHPVISEGVCSALTSSEYDIDTSVTGEQTIEVTITGLSRGTSYDCDIILVDDNRNKSRSKKLTFRTSRGGGGIGSVGSSINIKAPTFGDVVGTDDTTEEFVITEETLKAPTFGSEEDTSDDTEDLVTTEETLQAPTIESEDLEESVSTTQSEQTLVVGQVSETIREAQEKLNETDCKVSQSGAGSPGQETTYLGSRTQQALRCFQNENNLPETGLLDEQTQIILFHEEKLMLVEEEVMEQTKELTESLTRRIEEIQTVLRRLLIERIEEELNKEAMESELRRFPPTASSGNS